ncbi:3'-5' exonuclease [Flaviaesturariibacter aridisoli]|uniref:3'-5' exonuclease n=1 Tax=Flaviaesturariibacter aridisoli TaxID=2545761 RepID=A0A4R4DYN5_9BACT|nr:3'-5' exonuclease [Flaviaesturariibacter aridisoli]TCZ66425.1 3'-5' exonuclease [Flaviaesturariibacter aridisoli]
MNFSQILFLDIETVPQYADYNELPDHWRGLWDAKAAIIARGSAADPASLYERAGIYAEFGKIICISYGWIEEGSAGRKLLVNALAGHDEADLLRRFGALLQQDWSRSDRYLCAHNGKEFDYPYLCRRFVINGIAIPEPLLIAGRKPWEVRHLDTMELWKFGDFKSYTSLALLAACLGVPSPKDDIDGSMVGPVYWKEGDLARIRKYCQKDVATVAQVLLRYHCEELIPDERVEFLGNGSEDFLRFSGF